MINCNSNERSTATETNKQPQQERTNNRNKRTTATATNEQPEQTNTTNKLW